MKIIQLTKLLIVSAQFMKAGVLFETTFPESIFPAFTMNGWGGIDGWQSNDETTGAQGSASDSVYLGNFKTTNAGTSVYREFSFVPSEGNSTLRFTMLMLIKKSEIVVSEIDPNTGEIVPTFPNLPEFHYNVSLVDGSDYSLSNGLYISALTGDVRTNVYNANNNTEYSESFGAVPLFDDFFTLTIDLNYLTNKWSVAVDNSVLFLDRDFILGSFTGLALGVDQLDFQFSSATLAEPDTYLEIDYISISIIPEPTTTCALVAGLCFCANVLRRSGRKGQRALPIKEAV